MLDSPAPARCRGIRRTFWLEAMGGGDFEAATLLICQKASGRSAAL